MAGRTLIFLLLVAGAARGAPVATFPADKIADLAPLLVHGEIAAIETFPDGRPRQITLFAWTAAPPEIAHSVVGHPESYPSFVRNLSHMEVQTAPDGTVTDRWQVDLPIGHFNGGSRMRTEPGSTGAIEITSITNESHTRWEFLPATGGGTVIVEYMQFRAPVQNVLLRKMLEKDPANETGMGLATGLLLEKSVAVEAARQAAAAGRKTPTPSGNGPGFQFLLERGEVAVIRSLPKGGLLDVSVVARIPVPVAEVLAVVRAPDHWKEFMPSVTAGEVTERDAAGIDYNLEVDGILLSVDTRYRMQFVPSGIDSLGVGGDLEGSRFRWDLSPTRDGGTLAVYRANHNLAASSFLLRAMINYEPLFEHGANVGVGVLAVSSVARRAVSMHHTHN